MPKSNTKHLVLGGARSGKSRFAENVATELANVASQPLVYLATATADDVEMKARIRRHQEDRHEAWGLIEQPLHLAQALTELDQTSVVLIECLTLWLSNCLHSQGADWQTEKQAFLGLISQLPHQLVMVSNEVGSGIVPMGELSRQYVDEIGWLHQELAQVCDHVSLVVAGLPQTLK